MGTGPATLTLGDLYGGECDGDRSITISAETLQQCCNSGYARARCFRAAEVEADAVRFLVKVRNFKGLEIAWATERDHHPVAVGVVHLASLADTKGQAPVLEQQARAYARAILWQG